MVTLYKNIRITLYSSALVHTDEDKSCLRRASRTHLSHSVVVLLPGSRIAAHKPKNNCEKASYAEGQQEFVVNKKLSKVKVSLAMDIGNTSN